MRRLAFLLLVAIMVLGACSSEPEVDGRPVYEWITLLRHDDWTQQEKARETLARLGEPALPYLKRSLGSTDPTVRRGVVLVLARMGQRAKPAVGHLLKLLRREEVDLIRGEILRALMAIDPQAPGVAETFRKRLRDRSAEVRRLAQQGLDLLTKKPAALAKADTPTAEKKQPALRQVLEEQLSGKPFALIAEVERQHLRAAVVWKPPSAGEQKSESLWVHVFRRQGQRWLAEGKPVILKSKDAPGQLSQLLQGADKQSLIRNCGIAKERLAEHLAQVARDYEKARAAGDTGAMAAAVERLAPAISYRQLLAGDIAWRLLRIDPGQLGQATLAKDGKSLQLPGAAKLTLGKCDSGVMINGWHEVGK